MLHDYFEDETVVEAFISSILYFVLYPILLIIVVVGDIGGILRRRDEYKSSRLFRNYNSYRAY